MDKWNEAVEKTDDEIHNSMTKAPFGLMAEKQARERAEEELAIAKDNAIRLLTSVFCIKHQEEARSLPFSEFKQKDDDCGCPWCAVERARKAEAMLEKLLDEAANYIMCYDEDVKLKEPCPYEKDCCFQEPCESCNALIKQELARRLKEK